MKTTIEFSPAKLRRMREHAGLSLHDLAARSGVHVRTLQDWENGEVKRPHPRNVARVLAALDGTITPPRIRPERDEEQVASWTDHVYVVTTHPVTTAAIGVVAGLVVGGAL